MSKKILIPAVLVAGLYLMSGKKSKAKSFVQEDVYSEEDVVVPDMDPEPKEPKNSPKKDNAWEKLPAYVKAAADLYIDSTPMVAYEGEVWAKSGKWGKYDKSQDYYIWLTNQVYWDVTVNMDKTTDLYTPIGLKNDNYDGSQPFLLSKGNKATMTLSNKGWASIQTETFEESNQDSKKRLSSGIALWSSIYSYVKHKLKSCPDGAVCKK